MRQKILITRRPPTYLLEQLSAKFDVETWDFEDQPIPRDVLLQKIDNIEGLLCLLTDTIDNDLFKKSHHLKVVSNLAVGHDNIDVKNAQLRGIQVTNTPGILTETTADLTFALMLTTARRIIEASNELRTGKWKTWSPFMLAGRDVHSSTLGIIGMGEIGLAVAKRAKGFGMKILYYNRTRKKHLEEEHGMIYTNLDELLQTSDVVSILTPLTPETKNMITLNELKMMKKTSILINTSRGGIVNESDLVAALKSDMIFGAGLDVYEQEPIPLDHPLLSLPTVVALPHIGSASVQTRMKMWELAALNLTTALEGGTPPNSVWL
ncbi:2-hydroxyacid dehydrogenase [Shouchella lehensis]|uniref:D-glycerate dehydrogenase n=1 Tax=Shouchella lehensis TaxID=300825 RepID=A0A4Y7WEC0_9BACI|nr:D-glycerate dehydrogenase [Shouchella lehensis]MBG9784742.1 glyoxylate reductase [Shouchella lehensis]TES46144.1 D-glycerate dehydrogenase [Shouchella lehensis]